MESILLNEKKFSDFEAYAENMLKWNLELDQLSRGKFDGYVQQIILPNVIIQKYSVSQSLKLTGTAPKGFQNFSIPIKGETMPIWKGKELGNDSIALFPENGEVEAITPDGFETYELAVSNNYMDKIRSYMGLSKDDIILIPDKVYQCDKRLLNKLKLILKQSIYSLNTKSDAQTDKNFIEELEHLTVSILLNLFTASVSEKDYKQTSKRRDALKRIEDVTNNLNLEHITVPDLCQQAGVSIRTLEYAFREKYNMTPKQYLRTIKLNKVKKTLSHSNPTENSIADIANQNGFWHMGQFAKDYKNLFGELPSETTAKVK